MRGLRGAGRRARLPSPSAPGSQRAQGRRPAGLPRTGLPAELPPILRERGPRRLIYVSCDPATLARDLARLGPRYSLVELEAFDLFPQTAHVETVVELTRHEGGGG